MKHTVTVEEIDAWMNTEVWHLAASSHGNGASKKLEMNNAKTFLVTDRGNVKYCGNDMCAAVQAYNGLP